MTDNRRFADIIQTKKLFVASPVFCLAAECPFYSIDSAEIFILNPFKSSFEVSTLTPVPEVLPYPTFDIAEGFFTNYSLVIVSKTSENRIKLFNQDFLLD